MYSLLALLFEQSTSSAQVPSCEAEPAKCMSKAAMYTVAQGKRLFADVTSLI